MSTKICDLRAWFLGPRAENVGSMEQWLSKALRKHAEWRGSFYSAAVEKEICSDDDRRKEAFENATRRADAVLNALFYRLEQSIEVHSPRYIAHMLSDPLMASMIGFFAGMLHNQNNVVEEVSPATTALERDVVRQLAKLVGFEHEGIWGHLTSGGTVANFEALWVARNKAYFPLTAREFADRYRLDIKVEVGGAGGKVRRPLRDLSDDEVYCIDSKTTGTLYEDLVAAVNEKFPTRASDLLKDMWRDFGISGGGLWRAAKEGVIITSETAHYSIDKVIEALGVGRANLLKVRATSATNYRMDVPDLKRWITRVLENRDPSKNRKIIAVVPVLGTTGTGSVDPLREIIEINNECRARLGYGFHIHVDAAYGGYTRLVPELVDGKVALSKEVRAHFEALKDADSVTVDPHKMGYVPYPCGAVLFRDATDKEFIRSDAPYLFHEPGGELKLTEAIEEVRSVGRYILEGSKPGASAAACWAAHQLALDDQGYGQIIGRTLVTTRYLAQKLGTMTNQVEILHEPDLNILCFRVKAENETQLKVKNESIYTRMKVDHVKRGFVISFEDEYPALRVCIMNPFTDEALIDEFVLELQRYIQELA